MTKIYYHCNECDHMWMSRDIQYQTCARCGLSNIGGMWNTVEKQNCPSCNGTGKNLHKCANCNGTGKL